VTEGEWDAMTAIQCGFSRCVSVPNGAPQQQDRQPGGSEALRVPVAVKGSARPVKQIIIAVDGDEPGESSPPTSPAGFGPERCQFVEYPEGTKDLNEVLLLYGRGGVRRNAQPGEGISGQGPLPARGVSRAAADDLASRRASKGSTIVSMTLGTFSVISGWAGHGKTSLLMRMLANLMERGVNVALGSFETMPRPILERRLRACLYRCGEFGPKGQFSGPADALLAKRLSVIAHTARDEDTELDLDYIIELAKVAVLRDGVRLLVPRPVERDRAQARPTKPRPNTPPGQSDR
jgi:twinkle protein